MWHYKSLHAGNYYLLKEKENSDVVMVYVAMLTDKCVLIEYQHPEILLRWYRKDDELHDVIEQLSEEHTQTYEELFERPHPHHDADWDEEEEDDNDDDEEAEMAWRTLESNSAVWDAPDEDEEEDTSRLN